LSHTLLKESVEPPTDYKILNRYLSALKEGKREPTERKIPKLFTTLNRLTFFNRGFNAAHHHSTDTYSHNSTELRTINRYNFANVLAIHIQRSSNSLWLVYPVYINQIGLKNLRIETYVYSVILSRYIVNSTGLETRAGTGHGYARVRVWVSIFGPSLNPYP
jgi:hypothetical protein